MNLFDTHCHLTDERFDEDREAVIARMRESGLKYAVVMGDASREDQSALALAERCDFLYAAMGLHPHDASRWSDEIAARIERAMAHPKAVALGEIGLDYHYDLSPRETQREVFRLQLDMAYRLNKPAVLHIREAHPDAIEILTQAREQGRLPRAVMHCFGGDWNDAQVYLDMGFMISFSGSLTFKNTPNLWETAQKMPLDRLLIETDSPYMAPIPMRGRRNEPSYVAYTATKAADLRGMDDEALAQIALENGKKIFGISE